LTAPPEPLAATAVSELATLGLPATAGIARTPLRALYAARALRPRSGQAAANRSRSSFSSSFSSVLSDSPGPTLAEERTRNDYEERER
jgi:hypothetical protein